MKSYLKENFHQNCFCGRIIFFNLSCDLTFYKFLENIMTDTSAQNLSTTYNPASIEQKWYELWENNDYFKPTLNKDKSFSIALPPPNVTGSLHMGHGFNNAIMDALTRFHRMKGYNTLWQPGTDHAGIATQMVVERQLGQEGISRHDLGREAFLKKFGSGKINQVAQSPSKFAVWVQVWTGVANVLLWMMVYQMLLRKFLYNYMNKV